jgi:hypothetical protein
MGRVWARVCTKGEKAVQGANARHLNAAGVGEEALISDKKKRKEETANAVSPVMAAR